MKRLLLFIALLISVCAKAQVEKIIPAKPNPPRLVNDYTSTLTNEQNEALNQKLYHYDDSTSTQIAIVIIPTTAGNSIDDVALEILRRWGIGSKNNNNGIVLLVAKNDHKVWITVGYGLEGRVSDLIAKTIIDNDITPNFKEGNFYRGLDKATDDLIKATVGEYQAPSDYHKKRKGLPIGSIIFLIIILLLIFGAGGNRNGGMMSRRGYRGFGTGWILGNMMGGGWSGGGSGGWSGGGGGGGFGGFGGGSGGGGGAGGGW